MRVLQKVTLHTSERRCVGRTARRARGARDPNAVGVVGDDEDDGDVSGGGATTRDAV